ncbi:MAG: hypothetical protein R3C68_00780 [Myxococcota bacterium]
MGAESHWGGAVNGPALVPPGVLDREPATRTGAITQRRHVQQEGSVVAQATLSDEVSSGTIGVEHVQQRLRFPTLVDGDDAVDDRTQRTTLLAHGQTRFAGLPWSALGVWQRRGRSHDGAQYRQPIVLTQDTQSDAVVGQIGTEVVWNPKLATIVKMGVGWRQDESRMRHDESIRWDIEDEWQWMHRPRFPGKHRRGRVDGTMRLKIGEDETYGLELRGSLAKIDLAPEIPGNLTATTYQRAALAAEQSHTITLYEDVERLEATQRRLRLDATAEPRFGSVELRVVAGMDIDMLRGDRQRLNTSVAPAMGIALDKQWGEHHFFVLVRREPEIATAQVLSFLHPNTPEGKMYRWLDDGDKIPQSNEAGALLSRTGGAYHRKSVDLSRPMSNQLALGWRTARFGPFRAVVTGVSRVGVGAYDVRLSGPAAGSFQPVTVHDPGGDGLGEQRLPQGGQNLRVYAREPGTEGQEIYELYNRSERELYAGAEIQLISESTSRWFLNLGAKGYWSIGRGAFGLFADRNDAGIIDESSAFPNQRLNGRGRLDNDRAFGINMLVGLRPTENLSIAWAGRYRDGQPMTRFYVAELPQGPTPVMAVRRGDPLPRFTFHMRFDMRLRYTFALQRLAGVLTLDAFNLLNSGTEILEDTRTGEDFRKSLEMVPGRSVLLGLGLEWQ